MTLGDLIDNLLELEEEYDARGFNVDGFDSWRNEALDFRSVDVYPDDELISLDLYSVKGR